MSTEEVPENKPVVETPTTESDNTVDSKSEKMGFMRTMLLALPLFFKFAIVLLIKFLTDLVVFPLLFLYRIARLTKRKVTGLFRKTDLKDVKPNGAGQDLTP